jgi:hypothetical protein
MRTGLMLLGLLALAVGGCATSASAKAGTPKSEPTGPTGPKRVKLAVLKVESDQFPELAKALNAQLRDVQVKGVDDYFISKVTLEVVQLSIECVEQTPNCLGQVGKSLSAQRLLVARLTPGATARKSKKNRPVTVSVTQIDAEQGTALQQAEKEFKNEQEAMQGITDVVNQAAGQEVAAKPSSSSAPPPSDKPERTVRKTKHQARAAK